MRPIALLIVSLFVATSAGARPMGRHAMLPPQPPRQVDLSTASLLRAETPIEDVDAPILRPSAPSQSARTFERPHLEIGALKAELSHSDEGPPQIGRYRLEGAAVLGSSISGNVDRQGASINFIWPTGR